MKKKNIYKNTIIRQCKYLNKIMMNNIRNNKMKL